MAFSFGPFIGFWSANDALAARGVMVIPAGGLSTQARLELARTSGATVVLCTPTYALHMAEVAGDIQIDVANLGVRRIIVAGEPGGSVPAIRDCIERAWNAKVIDHSGASEIGPWGYADEQGRGLYVNESQFIAEFLDVETGQPAGEGELAELVLTTLGRTGSPVIRYRTGDLVDWRPAGSGSDPVPRRHGSLRGGILGRLDDVVFVRGNNVYPAGIEGVVRRFREVAEYRVVVLESGGLTDLRLEFEPIRGVDGARIATLAGRIATAVRDALHFRITVAPVPTGTLPRFELKARRFVREPPP